ncbi:MAG: HAD family hydrolase, partial [Vallitaleaceae bacterium]|nr:HAD family hydrolase [Vallitaleaceae bacterium]
EKGIKTGIGTSNSKELVELIVNRFDLGYYFGSIRTSCEVEKGKPHPDIYLKVAADLGVKPENCLVFEDVPMGIMAGKNAGMKVCAVYDDFSKHVVEEIKTLSDYFINSFDELMEMIEDEQNETVFAN